MKTQAQVQRLRDCLECQVQGSVRRVLENGELVIPDSDALLLLKALRWVMDDSDHSLDDALQCRLPDPLDRERGWTAVGRDDAGNINVTQR